MGIELCGDRGLPWYWLFGSHSQLAVTKIGEIAGICHDPGDSCRDGAIL
jgi:hypothetical protein